MSKVNSFHWANRQTRRFMARGYLRDGESVEQAVDRIAKYAEHLLGIDGFADKFASYMARGWYSLATPVWTNFGLDRGLPISCYGSYMADDSASILYTAAEVGMMSKLGGGTSVYFGKLRPRGAPIRENGASNGSYSFARLFDRLIEVFNQGGTRRGQCAGYIDIDHPDIEEWLTIHRESSDIHRMYWGVCVSSEWIESMRQGDNAKRRLWAKVLESRAEVGIPYIFFSDNANKNSPFDKRIYASNLCVVGSSMAVTSEGIRRVKDLYEEGKPLILFDGEKPVQASPMRLIERNADVYTITTKAGRKHTVTGYHKVKTQRGMVPALELKLGDKIAYQRQEGLFGNHHDPDLAFLLGLYQADGTQTDNVVFIDIWEHNFDLREEIEACMRRVYLSRGWDRYEVVVPGRGVHSRATTIPTFQEQIVAQSKVAKLRLQSSKLKQVGFEKGFIPDWIWQGDKQTQAAYLKGLFYADGTVHVGSSCGNQLQLSLASTDKEFLRQIQIILTNLGISSRIYLLRKGGFNLLPDGKGGYREYPTRDTWRLVIGDKASALKFEALTGFLSRRGIFIEPREYRDNTKKWDEVVSVEYAGKEDVYCCTVYTDEHVWVCDGIITSNCTEIMLPASHDESFVCCLSSLNLLHYDDWKDTDAVETLVFFLDAVMEDFINRSRAIPFMQRAYRFASKYRALGMGVLGWHSLLQSKGIPFGSMAAYTLNNEIFKMIRERANEASSVLARRYGEPEYLSGRGMRNATLLAIAPTKSSSFILGQVSPSIEPYMSNYYIKDLDRVKEEFKNPFLKARLKDLGKDTPEVWESILAHNGSVQHLDFLSDEDKEVFRTFDEISQLAIVQQAAQRQQYIDQGQSLNLKIHPETSPRDVNKLVLTAHDLGIKSLYYQYSTSAAQEFARERLLECKVCES